MNPIIYFDELDKVSETTSGEEIINLLCHLVDTSQNTHFSDKYFSGIDIDMSRVLFVFSYNDESKISPILLDRFIKINTNKFNKDDKIIIAKDYLIPSICKNINFTREHVSFTNECLEYIITNYTKGEQGVRNLRRFLEKIITRINILHLLQDYPGNIEDIIPYSLEDFALPICINKDIADTIVKISAEDQLDPSLFGLYS
jgi:ATP-dependent Lon protease